MSDTAILEATLTLFLIEPDSISPIFSANCNFTLLALWMRALKPPRAALPARSPPPVASACLCDGEILHSSLSLSLSRLLC